MPDLSIECERSVDSDILPPYQPDTALLSFRDRYRSLPLALKPVSQLFASRQRIHRGHVEHIWLSRELSDLRHGSLSGHLRLFSKVWLCLDRRIRLFRQHFNSLWKRQLSDC
ncbi:hypothetical protein VTO58DRAFT_105466 [Aureobasidium pullulans]